MQWKRIWQNDHVVIARVRWMHLNITCLCRWNHGVWYVLFYGYDLEWLEIQSHEHEHALILVSGVSLHGINIFMGEKTQSVHRDKGYLCVSAEESCV